MLNFHMTGMAKRNQVFDCVCRTIIIEVSKTNDMMDIKRSTDLLFGYSAHLANMPIPRPRPPLLPLPIRAIVVYIPTLPCRAVTAAPVFRFPATKAFSITKIMLVALCSLCISLTSDFLAAPITRHSYRTTHPVHVSFAAQLLRSEYANVGRLSSSILVADPSTFDAAKASVRLRWAHLIYLATALTTKSNAVTVCCIITLFAAVFPLRPLAAKPLTAVNTCQVRHRLFLFLMRNTFIIRSFVLRVKQYGTGTTAAVCEQLGRDSILIDLGYQELQQKRTDNLQIAMEAYI